MNIKYILFIIVVALFKSSSCQCQQDILYKEVDTTSLFMKLYHPVKMDTTVLYPAIVFFFGGGWNGGSVKQFQPHAEYFSKRGIACFLVDYRVKKRQQTSPFESLQDAKSSIRFIRKHAERFNIDTSKIVAAGGSAGGHLAAATALIDQYNEPSDNMSISSQPNALMLFNPVIDNGPGGYGYDRIGDMYKSFSPLHNIKRGAPPTIIFLGTNDQLIPTETMEYYRTVMEKVGSRIELHLYDGQRHGFFNYANFEYYKKTLNEGDIFLQSLGYLKKDPMVSIE